MSLLKRLHHALPPGFRKSYRFVVVLVEKIKRRNLPVSYYDCYPEGSNQPLAFTFVGWDHKLCAYWLNRIGGSAEKKPGNQRVRKNRIPAYIGKLSKSVDLILLEGQESSTTDTFEGGFLLPRWMEMEVDIETSLKTSRIKNITRNIRKNRLEYEIRSGKESFDLFYHNMYVPFSKLRHGESADISDYKHFSNKYQKESADLFFILKEGEPVAAAYIDIKESSYRVSAFGVLEASEEIFKMGGDRCTLLLCHDLLPGTRGS